MLLFSNLSVQIFVIESVIIMLFLSWLMLIASKLIFKQYFTNRLWRNSFLVMIVSPSIVQVYLASFYALGSADALVAGSPLLDLSGTPSTEEFNSLFFPLITVFFVVYLVYFIVRLVRYKKEKRTVPVGKE